jgi:hypothetical protein
MTDTHPTTIDGTAVDEFVLEIIELPAVSLRRLFSALSEETYQEALADENGGKDQLAGLLFQTSRLLKLLSESFFLFWNTRTRTNLFATAVPAGFSQHREAAQAMRRLRYDALVWLFRLLKDQVRSSKTGVHTHSDADRYALSAAIELVADEYEKVYLLSKKHMDIDAPLVELD